MNISFDFRHKSVVVTGGAQGIGLEIAKRLLLAGAFVEIWDYSDAALSSAQSELASCADGRLHAQRVDVSNIESCATAASKTAHPVDILVNNAGITRDKSFAKMSAEEFNAVIQTNLSGMFNVTKALQEHFSSASHKRIINMASVVALYGNFGQANYAAAKAGVIGLTKSLAREMGRKGFTVNAIAPGFVLTKMTQAMPKPVLDSIVARVPVARMATPEDIANTCLYLASEEASYINGTVISVDGGLTL